MISSADYGPIPGHVPPPAPAPSGLICAAIRDMILAHQSEADSSRDQLSAKTRADLESNAATPGDVVCKEQRAAKGIAFAKGLPKDKEGTYVDGIGGKKHESVAWDRTKHRIVICNMKDPLIEAANEKYGDEGTASPSDRPKFWKLVDEEKAKAKAKAKREKQGKDKARANPVKRTSVDPSVYTARAVLGLILLLASVLR